MTPVPHSWHSRRRRGHAARRRFLVGMALFVFSAVAFALVSSHLRDGYAMNSRDLGESTSTDARAADDDRPVYPFSIIAGGAHTPAELKAAIDADPVVRTHFANFDLTKTQVVRLDAPRVAHVSYRVGNNVYWTRKTVVLSTGEEVLTDGQHVARTRCGNQVADVPATVSASEPAPIVLDTPVSTLTRGPLTGLAMPPMGPVGGTGSSPSPSGSMGGGGGPVPGGSLTRGRSGAPVGGGPTATPTTNPSLQPSAGDNPTPGTKEDPAPEAPGGGTHGRSGSPGDSNLPPNPLPPADVIPRLQTPPPGDQPPPNFDPPPANPPGLPPPTEGSPHTDHPSQDPQTPAPIPEPSSVLLFGASAGAWLARRRRARRRRNRGTVDLWIG